MRLGSSRVKNNVHPARPEPTWTRPDPSLPCFFSPPLLSLGVEVGTQERVSAAIVLDCHEMIKCFLIIPALYTWPEIESRISLEYWKLVIGMLLN